MKLLTVTQAKTYLHKSYFYPNKTSSPIISLSRLLDHELKVLKDFVVFRYVHIGINTTVSTANTSLKHATNIYNEFKDTCIF